MKDPDPEQVITDTYPDPESLKVMDPAGFLSGTLLKTPVQVQMYSSQPHSKKRPPSSIQKTK